MEQRYSNLVQKYLANTLTASEQMELAALSRLYEPRQMLGGMIFVEPFMLEEGMVEQEEAEEAPAQVAAEEKEEEDADIEQEEETPQQEEEAPQKGETILIKQQHIEEDDLEDDDDDFEEDEEDDDDEVAAATPAHKNQPDHEFSYLSLAYGKPPSRNRQVFEELDSRISNWSRKPDTLPLSSRNTWDDKPIVPPPPSRNRQMFEQLESRVAGWKESPAPDKPAARRKVPLFFTATVAVVAVLCISYYWQLSYKASQRAKELHNRQLVSPGSNKATLVLSDGSAMSLSGRRDGLLAIQGGIEVLKSGDIMLEYRVPAAGVKEIVSNTIATPRGGVYQLSLPDGTHITLNAASSLTFPTVFSGTAREVVLTGEAFFEVAEDTVRPFRVKAGETVVEAIGTSFNIMSYSGEPQQTTTMVSGSVKLNAQGIAYIIRPGEQAVLHYNPRSVQVRNANVEEEVAWKNGKFRFINRNLSSILNQAARWYNMDVEWEGDFSGVLLSADTSRDVPLSGLLDMLETSGQVHFKTAEKRLIVYPGRW